MSLNNQIEEIRKERDALRDAVEDYKEEIRSMSNRIELMSNDTTFTIASPGPALWFVFDRGIFRVDAENGIDLTVRQRAFLSAALDVAKRNVEESKPSWD